MRTIGTMHGLVLGGAMATTNIGAGRMAMDNGPGAGPTAIAADPHSDR